MRAEYAPYVRNPEYDHMTGCRNCGGKAHASHPDLCCQCFDVAFGRREHREECGPTFRVCPVCDGQGATWKRGQLKVPSNATLCPRCEGGGEVCDVE